MMNWKGPNIGPVLHGLAVWLITDGLPVLQYLQAQLAGETTRWDWNRFLVGLAAAIVAALISASRNQGAVSLNVGTAAAVKGIADAGGSAMVVTVAEPARTEGSAPNLEAGQTVIIPRPSL